MPTSWGCEHAQLTDSCSLAHICMRSWCPVNLTTQQCAGVKHQHCESPTRPFSQAFTEISPQTLPVLLALVDALEVLVLRLLILLASAIPLAMTMRTHMGSRLGPTRVMLSCFTLQGHTQEPCKWAISSRVPTSTSTIFRGTDRAAICHLQSRLRQGAISAPAILHDQLLRYSRMQQCLHRALEPARNSELDVYAHAQTVLLPVLCINVLLGFGQHCL